MTTEINNFKDRLLELFKTHALTRGDFILSSGRKSTYYLDGRIITLSAEGAYLIARIILDMIKDEKIEAIGGPTIGADPIVGAIAAVSFLEKKPIKTFIVRKAPKPHGKRQKIEGPNLSEGARVIILDDVATTGKSIVESIQVLRAEGFKVDTAITVVDRDEGAKEALAKSGCKLLSIFSHEDFK